MASRRVRQGELSAAEKQLMASLEGCQSVEVLAEKAGQELDAWQRSLQRLESLSQALQEWGQDQAQQHSARAHFEAALEAAGP